jgi:hypothetical protein
MKHALPLVLAALLAAAPLQAQETEPAEGPGLIQEGIDMIFGGFFDEVSPAIEDVTGIAGDVLPTFQLLAAEMGPAFAQVFGQIDSIAHYEPPTFLPNGDIILRRTPDAPAWTPPEVPEPAAPGAEPGAEPEL